MAGFKHLIECHCYLSIFKNKEKITNHRFPVYSKVDYLGNVKSKIVKCNNCEAMHRVYSFGKSEIIPGKDDSNIVASLEDLKYSLPENICRIFENHNVDTSTFEHAIDIIEEKRWGEPIVLKREIVNSYTQVKVLVINEDKSFKILNEKIENILES